MKKNKLILAALSVFILSLASCSDEGTDTYKCFLKAKEKAGDGAKIAQLPDKRYSFIVEKPDGTLWLYRCDRSDVPDVTVENQIW